MRHKRGRPPWSRGHTKRLGSVPSRVLASDPRPQPACLLGTPLSSRSREARYKVLSIPAVFEPGWESFRGQSPSCPPWHLKAEKSSRQDAAKDKADQPTVSGTTKAGWSLAPFANMGSVCRPDQLAAVVTGGVGDQIGTGWCQAQRLAGMVAPSQREPEPSVRHTHSRTRPPPARPQRRPHIPFAQTIRTHAIPAPSHFPRQPSLVALFLSLGLPPPHLAPSTCLSPALSLVRQPSFSSSTIYQDFVGKVSLLSSSIARSYTRTTTNNLHEDSSATRSGRRIPTYTNHYDTLAISTRPGS